MSVLEQTYDQHKLKNDAEEVVQNLPALLLEAELLANTVINGVHGRRRAGNGEDFWQYRPFVEGDVSTQIDWRQSARSDHRLYIRQREWEVAATAWLWRDPSPRMQYHSRDAYPSKAYRGDLIATALCSLLASAGERVGHLGGPTRPFIGRLATERFATSLLSQQPDENSLPPSMETAGMKKAIFISDFFLSPQTLERRFKEIAASGVHAHLVQIIDPAEEDFPFKGRTEFLSTQSNIPALLFGSAENISANYRKLYKEHRAWLRDICAHYGWGYTNHRTDHKAETVLIALYQALSFETGGQ